MGTRPQRASLGERVATGGRGLFNSPCFPFSTSWRKTWALHQAAAGGTAEFAKAKNLWFGHSPHSLQSSKWERRRSMQFQYGVASPTILYWFRLTHTRRGMADREGNGVSNDRPNAATPASPTPPCTTKAVMTPTTSFTWTTTRRQDMACRHPHAIMTVIRLFPLCLPRRSDGTHSPWCDTRPWADIQCIEQHQIFSRTALATNCALQQFSVDRRCSAIYALTRMCNIPLRRDREEVLDG